MNQGRQHKCDSQYAQGKARNAYINLNGISQGKKSLGGPKSRQEDKIKINFKVVDGKYVNCISSFLAKWGVTAMKFWVP
jgi:hypothetical protein